jgi:DnaJ-like protein
MAERKPTGMSFETWVDRQIREGQERGAFDNLPGAGKPIPGLDKPFDMDRWVADWARREGLSTEAMLPEPLRLRKEIERLPDVIRDLRSEQAVREVVEDLNQRIRDAIRRPSGPQLVVASVDTDKVVEQWRASRPEVSAGTDPPAAGEEPPRRVRWWRRGAGRRRGSG